MSVTSRESRVESHEPPAGLPTTDDRLPAGLTHRVVVERLRPQIDGGRFPIKRAIGESVEVHADIFADGYDEIAAVLRDRHGMAPWRETPMTLVAPGTDEWSAAFSTEEIGWHEYSIVAWVDRFRTW